jgi:large subunit ribosomal protein L25
MATLHSSRVLHRMLRMQRQLVGGRYAAASTSSGSPLKFEDPSKIVSGLTAEQVDSNPEIAEFLKANFSEEAVSEEGSDGFRIPSHVLTEYGYSDGDFAPIEGNSYDQAKVDLGLGSPEQQALNIRKLQAYLRPEEGTNDCRRLRVDKIIPGIIYGSDPTQGILSLNKDTRILLKTPWPEVQRELDRFHRRFESRVYDLTVYEDESDTQGTVHRVMPRDVQRHPVQGKIYCANFVRYHAGRSLKLPIVYINEEESPALKRDGYIVPVNKYIECFVEEGVPIPEAIELECTGVLIKDVLRMDRLIFPDGVRPSDRINAESWVVGPVFGGRSGAVDDADDAVADGAAEAEVTGEKKD